MTAYDSLKTKSISKYNLKAVLKRQLELWYRSENLLVGVGVKERENLNVHVLQAII
jgi:hypothetical protein